MLVGFHIGAAGFFTHGPKTQADFLLFGIHLDDLEVMLLTGIKLYAGARRIRGFRVVAEAFNAFGNFNERAELCQAQHLSMNYVANAMRLEEALPCIRLKLLHAQRQATLLRLNAQNNSLYFLAFFQDLRRMLDALCPAQIAHVDQSINSVFNLDESAKVSQVAYAAFNRGPNGILLMQPFPRIRLKLFQSKRNAALIGIHVQHNALNLIAD